MKDVFRLIGGGFDDRSSCGTRYTEFAIDEKGLYFSNSNLKMYIKSLLLIKN